MLEVLIVGYVVIGIAIVLVQLAVFNYQVTQLGKLSRSSDFFKCTRIERKVIVALASVVVLIIWPYALFELLKWMIGKGDWE